MWCSCYFCFVLFCSVPVLCALISREIREKKTIVDYKFLLTTKRPRWCWWLLLFFKIKFIYDFNQSIYILTVKSISWTYLWPSTLEREKAKDCGIRKKSDGMKVFMILVEQTRVRSNRSLLWALQARKNIKNLRARKTIDWEKIDRKRKSV
jgi:hypothetical protein